MKAAGAGLVGGLSSMGPASENESAARGTPALKV
jgi:hypothetical protein